MVIDKHSCPGLQPGYQVSEDPVGVGIQPVVKYITKEIEVGYDGLIRKEVMRHKFDPVNNPMGQVSSIGGVDDLRPVLDDKLQRWVYFRNRSADGAVEATHINDGSGT